MINIFLESQNSFDKMVLATIVNARGSTPRNPGTRMLVGAEGVIAGTIGGGIVEKTVLQRAAELMEMADGKKRRAEVLEGLATTHGSLDVMIEFFPEGEFWQFAADCQKQGRRAVIVTALFPPYQESIYDLSAQVIYGERQPDLKLSDEDFQNIYQKRLAKRVAGQGKSWLVEPLVRIEKLLILGAGYVASWVAYGAKPLGFQVTVIDDRKELAQAGRIPGADQVIHDGFVPGIHSYQPDEDTYVVIATWSHQTDEDCLEAVLNYEVPYVGMLGSRKKISGIVSALRDKGIPAEKLDRLKAPIGLEIGAKTPQEIAVSILAEIILCRSRS